MNDKVKNVAIQQLNVTYIPTEDRLLLKIGIANQSELSVWLTYRVTKRIARLLQQMQISVTTDARINTPYSQALEQRFAQEELLKKIDFSKDYEERQSLNQGQLFLVIDCLFIESDAGQRKLELICANKQTVSVALNDELLLGLTNLLQQASQQATWDFAFSEQTLLTHSKDSNTLLH